MRIVIYLSVRGRMKNELSVNSDDAEEVCVWVETAMLSGDADLALMRLPSLFFVLGRSFRLELYGRYKPG